MKFEKYIIGTPNSRLRSKWKMCVQRYIKLLMSHNANKLFYTCIVLWVLRNY